MANLINHLDLNKAFEAWLGLSISLKEQTFKETLRANGLEGLKEKALELQKTLLPTTREILKKQYPAHEVDRLTQRAEKNLHPQLQILVKKITFLLERRYGELNKIMPGPPLPVRERIEEPDFFEIQEEGKNNPRN